jgi:16S rRNA (cytosine967-C5)-methyltransferase
VVADGCDYVPPQLVDAVLIDVPCTATGTGSKRPDVLRRDSDLTELLQVQQKLVRHAADHMVRVGGIIVYATCSLLKQESEDQVMKLLARTGSSITLKTVPFQTGEIPGFDDAIDSNGWIRVLPGALEGSLGQCDGFFVARLQRIN